MKKFLAVFLALLLTSFAAYADGETTQIHSHCACGKTECEERHEETDAVNWQVWNGDTTVGTVTDSSAAAIYLYLENDVTIQDTLEITNVTVFLCLNGKTLTIDKEGYPAVSVCENQKFVLCDCEGTGKITGAKGSAEKQNKRFGTINGRSGSNIVMYGGSISDNTVKNSNGGGIYVNGGTLTIYGGSFVNNKAPNGSGGAFSVENGTLNVYGGEMKNNSAINGGAIHLKGNTTANIKNIKATNNTASNMGGAIFTEIGKPMEIKDSEFAYNNAKNGGAICIKSTVHRVYSNIRNVNVHDNTATGSGGGFYLTGGDVYDAANNIYGSTISNNTAGTDGGGIYATTDTMVNLYGGNIIGNSCNGNGGGICTKFGAYLAFTSGESTLYIKKNSAKIGGGISMIGHSFITNGKSVIEKNTATISGGGINITCEDNFWLTFTDMTITKNTAPLGGGVFLNKCGTRYELELGAGVSIIENTTSENGAPSNLHLNNGKTFQFRKGLYGNEKIGVSVSGTPTLESPIDIESEYNKETHDKGGNRSDLIVPDDDIYEVIYENNMHRLVPKSYSVTFDPKNGEDVKITKVQRGGTISGFDYPEREGYRFDAWYVNGAAYNFDRPVNGDITLVARWIKSDETALTVTPNKIVTFRLNKPGILFVASYDENKLLDIKTKEIAVGESEEYIGIFEIGLNTNNATKISAFLWDNSNGITNMQPLCESGAAEVSAQ